MNEGERKTLQKALREAWLDVVAGAEAEAARAAQRLLDVVGVGGEGEPPARVKQAMHELADRLRTNRDELERRVEEGVRAAVARAKAPISAELSALRGRIEQLHKRVEALGDRGREPPRD